MTRSGRPLCARAGAARALALPVALACVLLLSLRARAADELPPEPAPGGVGLIEAAESGARALVGRVRDVESLDVHGQAASLEVERVLGLAASGREDALEAGDRVRIAWEDLAPGRPPRFAKNDRVLVCVEPLPGDSIWLARIPNRGARESTAAVAMNGDAFVRDPSLGTLDALHHYLSLAPGDRESATGVAYLLSLAANAEPPIASDAARRLAVIASIGERLPRDAGPQIARALAREDASFDLAPALLEVVAAAASPSLADALLAATRSRDPAPPARLFEALALASGALPASDAAWLLASDDAGYRAVAARTASGPDAAAQLRRLIASDPAPEVRAHAVDRLAALERAEALPALLGALADADPAVRSAAATAAASLAPASVDGLRKVVDTGSPDAARAAISALGLAGGAGRSALSEIAATSPDESLRKLAGIALGALETHTH